ncbi:MAG: tyrosine-type recombinase/integrase [Bacillota bacterium]
MAHIRKTESGNYEAFIDMGKDPATGKRRQITKTFETKKEANLWTADKIQEKQKGIAVSLNNLTLEEYLLKWLDDYALPNLSPTTFDGYNMIIKKHIIPALGALKLDEIKPLHIQSYQSEKLRSGRLDNKPGGLSKKTVLQHHRVLNKALNQAVMWQLISYNPVKAVPALSPDTPEIKSLSQDEVNRLLKAAEDSWSYYFIYIAVNTGMRRGELLGLRWEDINFTEELIQVRKNLVKSQKKGIVMKEPKNKSSKRVIQLAADDISELKKLKKKQNEYKLLYGPDYNNKYDLVFCKANGEILYPNTATKRFNLIAEKANIENIRLHDLRHTHATLMLEAGVHPKVVQERLGHSTITTTLDTYSHVIPSMQKESVEKYKNYIS